MCEGIIFTAAPPVSSKGGYRQKYLPMVIICRITSIMERIMGNATSVSH